MRVACQTVQRCAFVAVALAIAAVGHAQSAGFCSELASIVRAADTDFEALRGAPAETGRSLRVWEASSRLPGATRCEISRGSDTMRSSFSCTWHIADEDRLDEQYRQFIEAAPSCFPDVPPRVQEERASEFEPGRLRPASVRFSIHHDLTLSISKWTAATSSTRRSRITMTVTRWNR